MWAKPKERYARVSQTGQNGGCSTNFHLSSYAGRLPRMPEDFLTPPASSRPLERICPVALTGQGSRLNTRRHRQKGYWIYDAASCMGYGDRTGSYECPGKLLICTKFRACPSDWGTNPGGMS
jgi:hypothetical protein